MTTRALTVALCLFVYKGYSTPRPPIPPVPEQAPIYHETFDEDYLTNDYSSDIAIPGFGFLDQSWSGYALSRSGESLVPYAIPALDSTGYTNIACGAAHSACRFWITPMWSSQSQSGGTGPGIVSFSLKSFGSGKTLDNNPGKPYCFPYSNEATLDGSRPCRFFGSIGHTERTT